MRAATTSSARNAGMSDASAKLEPLASHTGADWLRANALLGAAGGAAAEG